MRSRNAAPLTELRDHTLSISPRAQRLLFALRSINSHCSVCPTESTWRLKFCLTFKLTARKFSCFRLSSLALSTGDRRYTAGLIKHCCTQRCRHNSTNGTAIHCDLDLDWSVNVLIVLSNCWSWMSVFLFGFVLLLLSNLFCHFFTIIFSSLSATLAVADAPAQCPQIRSWGQRETEAVRGLSLGQSQESKAARRGTLVHVKAWYHPLEHCGLANLV